jgi:hypothetical protein
VRVKFQILRTGHAVLVGDNCKSTVHKPLRATKKNSCSKSAFRDKHLKSPRATLLTVCLHKPLHVTKKNKM